MTSAFNERQFSDEMADGIENLWWYVARNRIILKYIKKFKLDNILDIGCGRGIVTSYLYNSGINITGVELGVTTPIDKKSGLKIYFNTDALDLPEDVSNSIKTIAMFDVLEHIEDPVGFLKSVCDKFPNVKNLVMCVPARKELWTNYDVYYGHFRRYNFKLMQDEMAKAGFKIDYNRYFYNALYFLIGMNNIIKKSRHVKLTPPANIISKGINKLAISLLSLEAFLAPKNMVGSSMLCVCTKINKA